MELECVRSVSSSSMLSPDSWRLPILFPALPVAGTFPMRRAPLLAPPGSKLGAGDGALSPTPPADLISRSTCSHAASSSTVASSAARWSWHDSRAEAGSVVDEILNSNNSSESLTLTTDPAGELVWAVWAFLGGSAPRPGQCNPAQHRDSSFLLFSSFFLPSPPLRERGRCGQADASADGQ